MSAGLEALLAVPFGLGIGLALGMVGGGGAVLAVPVLVYVLGHDAHAATTASLAVAAAGAGAGALAQARRRCVCWRHAGAFSAVAVGGIAAGTAANRAIGGDALLLAFGGLMIVAGVATQRRGARPGARDTARGCPRVSRSRFAAASVGAGSLTGFFGVGGGFVIVPALVFVLAFPFRLAVGTSLVIVACVSLLGFGTHLVAGADVAVATTAVFAATCAAGAGVGGMLAGRVPQRTLAHGFAFLLAVAGVYVVVASVVL